MKEKPILFSSENVKLILVKLKTQTRRVKCSFEVGDYLWVRETYYRARQGFLDQVWLPNQNMLVFKDGRRIQPVSALVTLNQVAEKKPSIFMPRWASTLSIKVTGIRNEPLQSITPEDCVKEGWAGEKGKGREWYAKLWDSLNKKNQWSSNPNVHVIDFKEIERGE
mgnify:FL=1